MSPYYKQAARGTGANLPPARDWCGVFFALHERPPRQKRWVERAYAYNLYNGGQWSEPNATPQVGVGGSDFAASSGGNGGSGNMVWRVQVGEPGLWRGEVHADLTFSQIPTRFPQLVRQRTENDHTWICAAPLCDMNGTITLSPSQTVSFAGSGYHDHNFGYLPLQTTDIWYWGRAPLHCDDNKRRQAVFYHLVNKPAEDEEYAEAETTWLAFEEADGQAPPPVRENLPLFTDPTRNVFGLKHHDRVQLAHNVLNDNEQWRVALRPEWGAFSEGPFYRRLPITISAQQQTRGRTAWAGKGEGIGEVFRPSRMLGPIASRAMWSRLRKRRRSA